MEAVLAEVEADFEAEAVLAEDSEAEADIVEAVVVEDLLEGLELHVQLQDLEGVLIHMVIMGRIIDIIDPRGGIIDLGITVGGTIHGGRGIIIALGIILRYMLAEVFYSLLCLH